MPLNSVTLKFIKRAVGKIIFLSSSTSKCPTFQTILSVSGGHGEIFSSTCPTEADSVGGISADTDIELLKKLFPDSPCFLPFYSATASGFATFIMASKSSGYGYSRFLRSRRPNFSPVPEYTLLSHQTQGTPISLALVR